MLHCAINSDRGSTSILGLNIPDGPAVLTRTAPGKEPYVLRGGQFTVDNSGFVKEDPEVPFGKPLTYTLAMSLPDARVQTNYVPTPSFTHGLQGWQAGPGRGLSVVTDATAPSGKSGAVTAYPAGYTSVAAPTLVGSAVSGVVAGSYTLTPSGTVAVGDWLYLIHNQVGGLARPSLAGWGLILQQPVGNIDVTVWRRKRVTGDAGYTVTAPAGSNQGVLLWVRGSSDTYVPLVSVVETGQQIAKLTVPELSVIRPSLLLSVVAAALSTGATAGVSGMTGTDSVITTDSTTRRLAVGVTSVPDTAAPDVQVTFPQTAVAAAAATIIVQAEAPVTNRIIATTPAGVIPASGEPYLMTGRFKFRTGDLWIWEDVKAQGTWGNLKATRANWAAVVSATTTTPTTFMRFYVDIVSGTPIPAGATIPGTTAAWATWVTGVLTNPSASALAALPQAVDVIRSGKPPSELDPQQLSSTGGLLMPLLTDIHRTPTRSARLLAASTLHPAALEIAVLACNRLGLPLTVDATVAATEANQAYVAPVQVIVADAPRTNTWIDFSFYFTTGVDIPADAVIRFTHGPNLREFAVRWQLDRIGITSAADREDHTTLPWFDGDTPVPASPVDYLFPDGAWTATSTDAYIRWTGAVGASPSVFYGPTRVFTTTTCQMDVPADVKACSPVYLSDPISPARGGWYSLLGVGDLTYAARRNLLDIIGRGPQIAVSQTRGWASGTFTLLTKTLDERALAVETLSTGRILLYRNPDPSFPEDAWYISVGDVTEARLSGGDQRRAERMWVVPFTQVERPVGLIEQAFGRSWADVVASWSDWAGVRRDNSDWLDLLYPNDQTSPVPPPTPVPPVGEPVDPPPVVVPPVGGNVPLPGTATYPSATLYPSAT